AALSVAVDDPGSPVDLIGLCQGGWLSLVYAARLLFSPEAAARCRQTAGANCALGAPMQQSA
ncbi:MAG: hypothetical protein ACLPSW_32460, partial [Roseiarcus sp.]